LLKDPLIGQGAADAAQPPDSGLRVRRWRAVLGRRPGGSRMSSLAGEVPR